MTAATIDSDGRSWDWFRVGAWSGSLIVHALVLALVLIAAPAIVAPSKRAPEPVIARWIEPDPSPPLLPEPPPPAVPHHVHAVPVRVQPQTPATLATVAVPATPVADAAPAQSASIASTSTTSDADIGAGATQTLAYATPLQPRYPPASVHAREQGTVLLRVFVDEAGVPQQVEIARSSGHARLDAAARESVMHARFRPVMRNGEATSAWGLVPIAFRLDQG